MALLISPYKFWIAESYIEDVALKIMANYARRSVRPVNIIKYFLLKLYLFKYHSLTKNWNLVYPYWSGIKITLLMFGLLLNSIFI